MKLRLLILLSLLMLLSGCGYHTPGTETTWVGKDGETLHVALFANRTAEPYLDNYVTEMVVRQLSRSRRLELTEDRQAADLVLEGVVSRFAAQASSFGSDDRIEDYKVTLDVQVRLLDNASAEVLWQEALSRSEHYQASVNKNQQLEEQAQAARLAAARLAEDLHARFYDAF